MEYLLVAFSAIILICLTIFLIYVVVTELGEPKVKKPKKSTTKQQEPKPYKPDIILVDPPAIGPPEPPKPAPAPQPTPPPQPAPAPVKEKTQYEKIVDDMKRDSNWDECYERTDLLTQNETNKFKIISSWAMRRGFVVMAKVRLADLIKRRPNKEWNNALFYKISQQHLDFVICDREARPIMVIEIQDSSHHTKEAMEKDAFKKIVLESNGYKLLQIYDVNDKILDDAIFSKSS